MHLASQPRTKILLERTLLFVELNIEQSLLKKKYLTCRIIIVEGKNKVLNKKHSLLDEPENFKVLGLKAA